MTALTSLLDLIPQEHIQDLERTRSALTVPDAAKPFLLAALVRRLGVPVLAVTARSEDAEHLARDVQAFLGAGGAEVFPGWEVLPGEPLSPSVETMGRRLDVLTRLGRGESFVVIATAQGITQLVAPPRDIDVIELRVGASLDLDNVATRLVAAGYERNYIVERRGEFAIRGGILDVFPPAAERPVRAELWGDEISSLRQFALASQRSLQELDVVEVAPCRELRADDFTMSRAATLAATNDDPALAQLVEGVIEAGAERLLPLLTDGLVPLASLFPDASPAVVIEPRRVRDRADEVIEQVEEWTTSAGITARHYAPLDEALAPIANVAFLSSFVEAGADGDLAVETWTSAAGKPEELAERLSSLMQRGYRAVIAASLPEAAETLKRNLAALGLAFDVVEDLGTPPSTNRGQIVVAELGRGFVLPWAELALVAESDITGRRSGAARRRIAA
ncbi:MAG: hypothetical protein M3290_07310, partial [Actinomycetota bacterium]|nr:hypothetical protein [Actinomycetota bacterium]